MRNILGPFVSKLTAGGGDFSAGPGPVTVQAPASAPGGQPPETGIKT